MKTDSISYYNVISSSIDYFFAGNQPVKLYLLNNSDSQMFLNQADSLNNPDIILHQNDFFSEFCGPYEPFMSTIKEWFRNDSDNRHVLKKIAYPLHYKVLLDYLSGKSFSRGEPMLIEESEYEITKFRDTLLRLFFRSLGGKKTVFMIDNAQFLPDSTIQFIEKAMTGKHVKIVFLLFYRTLPEFRSDSIEKLVDYAYEKRKQNSSLVEILKVDEILPDPVVHELSSELLYQLASEAITLLAYQDAFRLLKKIMSLHKNGEFNDEEDHYEESLILYVTVLVYIKEYREAFIQGNTILKSLNLRDHPDRVIRLYILLGIAEYYSHSYDPAVYYAQLAIKHSENYGLKRYRTLGYLLLFYIRAPQADTELFVKVLAQLREMGWTNIASYAATSGSYLHGFLRQNSNRTEEVLAFWREGMHYSRTNTNFYRISIAYHVLGGIYGILQNFHKSLHYLNCSKRIKRHNHFPVSRLYNAIGYTFFTIGNYKKAHSYYREAILQLKSHSFYDELCGSLYNLAKIHFFINEYRQASILLEDMLKIMNMLHIRNFAFQSRMNIYSLLGICHHHLGNQLISLNYYGKIKGLSEFAADHKDNPIYYLFLLYVYGKTDEYESIKQNIERCSHYEGPQFIIYALYHIGLRYKQSGNEDKAYEVWDSAIKISRKNNIRNYSYELVRAGLHNSSELILAPRLKRFTFDLQTIIEFIREESNMNELHKRITEIDFISRVQQLIITRTERDSLITEALKLLEISFSFDRILIYLSEDIFYINAEDPEDPEEHTITPQILFERLHSRDKASFILNDIECKEAGLCGSYKSLYFITNKNDPVIPLTLVMMSKENAMSVSTDDGSILKLFINQLSAALELLRTREELVVAAKTDKLTCLNNRMEMERIMDTEYKRILRYPKQPQSVFSLLFIDLDNFKYYNDTFGHHVGDRILVLFSRLLEECIRDVDFSARLGGDEFILMLPETHKEAAAEVAKRLYNLLDKYDHFIPELKQLLGVDVVIPEGKLLSCSIGITDVLPVKDKSASDFLIRADKALYKAKESGKNTYVIF